MVKIPKFIPTLPEDYPLKEDVVGQAKEFIEDLDINIGGKGIFYSLGINPNKTYLLTGPAGTGKTMSVRAFNNSKNKETLKKIDIFHEQVNQYNQTGLESTKPEDITINDFNFLTFEYDIGKYGTAYINMGSVIVQNFFDTVFFYANTNKDVLISIDEADALLTSRKSNIQSHTEDRKVLETIMKNLQTAHDKKGVYVVLMSNLPEIMDDASLRAGRIDKKIEFKLPNELERKLAFEKSINSANERAGYQVIRNYNLDNLVELGNEFNYADIFQSVERSLRDKATELYKNKEKGILRAGYIRQNRLEDAVRNHKKEFKQEIKKIGFN